MALLIKRDEVNLIHYSGKAYTNSDLPEMLKLPLNVSLGYLGEWYSRIDESDDLLLENGYNWNRLEDADRRSSEYLERIGKSARVISGLWSGTRSVVLRDPLSRRMFRLKGIAFNPHFPQPTDDSTKDYIRICGGQKKLNAEYEARMSSRFNRTLESVGIEPVMEPKGVWKYPVLCNRHRPTASVFEIKGDTRLDELVCTIEGLLWYEAEGYLKFRIPGSFDEKKEDKLDDIIEEVNLGIFTNLVRNKRVEGFWFAYCSLLKEIGFTVGRLKRLMDISGQAWNCEDSGSTNAHWGNIVLYRDAGKLKVNLVDFDLSCNIGRLSKSEVRDIQKKENKALREFNDGVISMRGINGKPRFGGPIGFFRKNLSKGFDRGYRSTGKKYSNELDLGRLLEIYSMLRENKLFTLSVRR